MTVQTKKKSVRGTAMKVRTTKLSPKTKMKTIATAKSIQARRNIMTTARQRLPIVSVEDIIETRGIITKETEHSVTIKLSREIIRKLKDLYLTSQRDKSEYVGFINATRERNTVKFNSPTRHTNWHPSRVFPPQGTNDNLIVYHSHPVPVSRELSVSNVTLPSKEDFTYYVRGYPKMQANIILERNGYYMVDLLESDNFMLPNPSAAHDTFINLLVNKDINRYQVVGVNLPMLLFTVSINSWQKMFNTYIDKVMRHRYGLSIKYYRYTELPEITLKNPETVFPTRPA